MYCSSFFLNTIQLDVTTRRERDHNMGGDRGERLQHWERSLCERERLGLERSQREFGKRLRSYGERNRERYREEREIVEKKIEEGVCGGQGKIRFSNKFCY